MYQVDGSTKSGFLSKRVDEKEAGMTSKKSRLSGL
jgi:hypothetical protein